LAITTAADRGRRQSSHQNLCVYKVGVEELVVPLIREVHYIFIG